MYLISTTEEMLGKTIERAVRNDGVLMLQFTDETACVLSVSADMDSLGMKGVTFTNKDRIDSFIKTMLGLEDDKK